jgi:superfamily II DNA/RNA helicase
MSFRFLDNKTNGIIGDVLKKELKKGTKLSIISSYFTIHAYNQLKEELKKIDSVRLLFSEPTFVKEKKDIVREYSLNGSYEKNISGDKYEMRLKNELNQSEIAKECAAWIKSKVEARAYDSTYKLEHKFIICDNQEESSSITGNMDFSAQGLGYVPSEKPIMANYIKNYDNTQMFLNNFDNFWNDNSKVTDVKKELLETIDLVYKENSPEFIYYVTLYHIFKEYLEDLTEENIIKERTGFENSIVWKKLYKFQKDGVMGAIDKIEKFNGAIIADSVGLGKTFEALAVIKYYELRNYRVLVLCPKKLRENWTLYKQNDKRNILVKDRFSYDVLNHTDLSRYKGNSGDINLESINWENYDLIVIDESHNFRNNNNAKNDKETRYSRLMNKIIKSGVKTRVLLLSATPVNNRLNDLKNQVAFVTEAQDSHFQPQGIKSIEQTLRKAQQTFNEWNQRPQAEKTVENLLENLETDYFKLLDMISIARSRKHIQKYYDMSDIGKFPERITPINKKPDIDLENNFMPLKEVNKKIRALNLSIYSPLKYILPHKVNIYNDKYDKKVKNSVFRQTDREQSLIHLMRVNILKRMESSIYSFGLTVSRLLHQIDSSLDKIKNPKYEEDIEEIEINEIDIDDDRLDDILIGSKKVKVLLKDIDHIKWRQDLEEDQRILEDIIKQAHKIKPSTDAKLRDLRNLIKEKIDNPINVNNKKIVVFTAFADTANYLYDNLSKWLKDEYNLNSALVTGTGTNKTTMKKCRVDLNSILTNFSPISKERSKIDSEAVEEIDILIATDCISEGQNLQDCDFLVNYDIHWNPVRIIQRFGRIDRIGSKNTHIQLVNFWPNMELDEYINLEKRVSGRMVMLDISATGEENVIEQDEKNEMNDLEYRKNQLKQLQDRVLDIEDINGNISITDLTFNDFKMDLVNYMKDNKEILEKAPTGMYAISTLSNDETEKGIIYCLKKINHKIKASENNSLEPYYLVYIKESGEILYNYIQSKKILDLYKNLCNYKNTLYKEGIEKFNEETKNGANMKEYASKLEKVVENISGKEIEKGIQSLFSFGATTLSNQLPKDLDDFELIYKC